MKITDLRISMNRKTFEQEMVMTLTMPLEVMQDAYVQLMRDDLAISLGTKLLQQIDEQMAERNANANKI